MIFKISQDQAYEVAKLAVEMWQDNTIETLTEEFKDIIKDDNNAIFGYKQDNQIVAFCQVQLRFDYVEGTEYSPVAYLEGIFVKQNYRRQGIARMLVEYAEKWARNKNIKEFASDCEITNLESFEFHKKLGFIETNRIICFTKKL